MKGGKFTIIYIGPLFLNYIQTLKWKVHVMNIRHIIMSIIIGQQNIFFAHA